MSAAPTIDTTFAGPAELLALKSRRLMPCTYHAYRDPPQIVAGEGCTLIDHEGRRYLDCLAGVGVMNAGHVNAAIIEPAIEQIRALQHTTTIYLTEPMLRLADALATIVPVDDARLFFCASGSEAVEFALLAATLHTRRRLVIAAGDSLHGRTHWAMSVTGLAMWRSDPFLMNDRVLHVPFNDANALARAFEDNSGQVAAFIAEPIQGNGGINVPDDSYWPAVRALCNEHRALLVMDEVQTGLSRTGRWFGCDHWGVTPDVVALSKGLGNGFPIAAVAATREIALSFTKPAASTYGGNPVSAAAALATIAFHREHDLASAAAARGQQLLCGLRGIARGAPRLLDLPRGRGLMIGLPVLDNAGKPSAPRCDILLERLKDRGILAGKTGAARHVLTFMPPLTIAPEQIDTICSVLRAIVADID